MLTRATIPDASRQWSTALMFALVVGGGVMAAPREAAACDWYQAGNNCCSLYGQGSPVCCGSNQCYCECDPILPYGICRCI